MGAEPSIKSPDCWQCRHFAISWDTRNPYSCKLMGFKSRMIPSFEVFRADGHPCRGFMAKVIPMQNLTVVDRPKTVSRLSKYV
ncbi:hypothetical protein MCEMIEM12_01619 [Burkholderiaceae bacterium]|jgi:hypothetical protein